MLSSEEEERSGRKRRDEGRGQTRRHQRHMSGKDLFQTEKCKENWTNQKASGTYVVRREDVSKRILECFFPKYHLKELLWAEMGTCNEEERETHLGDHTFAMVHQI